MEHTFKCWPEYFRFLKNDGKNFEVRRDDRDEKVKVGDTVILKEYVPEERRNEMVTFFGYTGKEKTAIVTYVLNLDDVPQLGTVNMIGDPNVPFVVYGLRFQ